MSKKIRTTIIVMALIFSLGIINPMYVGAKTKYTKTEKKIARNLSYFQDELINPDSFKIKNIYKVKYVLMNEYADYCKDLGIYNRCKTLTYAIKYTAKNMLGGTVTDYVYLSSKYYYFDSDSIDFDEYIDKTNYTKSKQSKKMLKNVRKLTKKYYNE